MSSLDALLAASEQTSIEDVKRQMDDMESNQYDDGFWRPTLDDAGNATVELRFLPDPELERKLNSVMVYNHWFKGPTGKVYNEWCRTTIGEDDPAQDHAKPLWNTGYEADKKIASARGRKKNFISRVLVIREANKPENEGKIFLYKYGMKVNDKIKAAYKREFEGDEVINPYSMTEAGANFRLRIKKVAGWNNYDDSGFGPKGSLYGGDKEKMVAVFSGVEIPDLGKFKEPSFFKPYDELKKRLQEVLEESEDTTTTAESMAKEEPRKESASEQPKEETKPVEEKKDPPAADEDDDMAFFRGLQDS